MIVLGFEGIYWRGWGGGDEILLLSIYDYFKNIGI